MPSWIALPFEVKSMVVTHYIELLVAEHAPSVVFIEPQHSQAISKMRLEVEGFWVACPQMRNEVIRSLQIKWQDRDLGVQKWLEEKKAQKRLDPVSRPSMSRNWHRLYQIYGERQLLFRVLELVIGRDRMKSIAESFRAETA